MPSYDVEVTEADREAAHATCKFACSFPLLGHHGDHCHDIARAIAKARAEENEECARVALERLNHWRDNCEDNIKDGCAPPEYNMGARAEASVIMGRIAARRSAPKPEGGK